MFKKRFMALVLTTMMAASAFAGCSGSAEPLSDAALTDDTKQTGTTSQTDSETPADAPLVADSENPSENDTVKEPDKKKRPAGNLLDSVEAGEVSLEISDEQSEKLRLASADWAMELLRKCYKDGDAFISPLSIELALTMTANGAANETLNQMLTTMAGDGCDIDTLNAYLKSYTDSLVNNEDVKLEIANAIWTNEYLNVVPADNFLKNIKGFFDAGVYAEEFNKDALAHINDFCKEHTDGQIDKVLDELDPSALMVLVNALNFDAKWAEEYEEGQVNKRIFTDENGNETEMDMMNSMEDFYLSSDYCYGVKKEYKDGYSFVALLPNEGEKVADLVDKLDAKTWMDMLDNPVECDVHTIIPKFEREASYDLKEILADMGMKDAFDQEIADFSNMVDSSNGISDIFIDSVIHKTHIEVDEKGTKAAAVTVVTMKCNSANIILDYKEVHLDRPFVYAIVDNENNLPVFIGTFDQP